METPKIFLDMGVNPNHYDEILGVILASPDALAANIGIGALVRLAVYSATKLPPAEVQEFLDFKPTFQLGALNPDDIPVAEADLGRKLQE